MSGSLESPAPAASPSPDGAGGDWSLLQDVRAFALPHYQEPGRAYHNAAHVRHLLRALARQGVLTPTLALAVWGHDLIYDPRAKDNEARSAQVFGGWLASQGATPAVRAQVRALILATRHTAAPQTREEALLVDADLSILGAPPEEFAAYDAAILQEYRHVPTLLYGPARRQVLRGFMARERIFTTPEFAALEAQARQNLRSVAG